MMRVFRIRLFLLGLGICIQLSSTAQNSLLDSIINEDLIIRLVSHLSSDSMRGRLIGTKENASAAKFIAAELDKAGARPLAGNHGFYIPFSIYGISPSIDRRKLNADTGFNIIAALPGKIKAEEIIIFCAHYDHVGTSSTDPYPAMENRATQKGDTIFNGANDNASGVAALLALAKYFGRLNNNQRTLLFIAFSGEELGTVGSNEFVKTIKRPEGIKAVFNLEMLGRTADGRFGKPFITGSNHSNLRALLNKKLFQENNRKYGGEYFEIDPYPYENLFARSDNFPFALLGIPAHAIMAGSPTDPRYHSVQDEVESLNIRMMIEIVRAIATAAAPLIDGSVEPYRIDPKKF